MGVLLFRIESEIERAVYKMERPGMLLVARRLNIDIFNEAIAGVSNKFIEVAAQGVYEHRYSWISMAMCVIQGKYRHGVRPPFRQHRYQCAELDFVVHKKVRKIRYT